MRSAFFFLVALLGSLPGAEALGTLVNASGTTVALGEVSGTEGPIFLFPARAVTAPSWVAFPRGTRVSEVVLATAAGRTSLRFPEFRGPDTRFAVEVPLGLLSMEVRGRWSGPSVLELSPNRPGGTDTAWVTRSTGSLSFSVPRWTVPEGDVPLLTLSRPAEGPWKVKAVGSKVTKTFTFQPEVRRWSFAPEAWGFTPERIDITGPDPRLQEIRARAISPTAPIPADPATLLVWGPEVWRKPTREWFSWDGTSVLVLVTSDYHEQDAYLKRLAFFIEKTGFRGRIVPDEEMAALHGWNAHDYSAPDLARFFTEAARNTFPLHPEEIELRTWLENTGVIVAQDSDSWVAGTGALVGISHASPPALRSVLFVHEAFHGLYYTNPEFRAGVKAAWDTLSDGSRKAFRSFLALSDYDPSNEALMINEFQAYVLQRASPEWVPFFRDRVRAGPWVSDLLGAAKTVEGLVTSLYGLKSGAVSRITVF